jgi:hypothetical protein
MLHCWCFSQTRSSKMLLLRNLRCHVDPTHWKHFYFSYQTFNNVAAGEPHPQPLYQTSTSYLWIGGESLSNASLIQTWNKNFRSYKLIFFFTRFDLSSFNFFYWLNFGFFFRFFYKNINFFIPVSYYMLRVNRDSPNWLELFSPRYPFLKLIFFFSFLSFGIWLFGPLWFFFTFFYVGLSQVAG